MGKAEGSPPHPPDTRQKGQMVSEFLSFVPPIFAHKSPPLRTAVFQTVLCWLLNLSFLLPWRKSLPVTGRPRDFWPVVIIALWWWVLLDFIICSDTCLFFCFVLFFSPQQRCATYQNLKGNKNVSSPSCCSSGTCRSYLLNTAEQQRNNNHPLPGPLSLCDYTVRDLCSSGSVHSYMVKLSYKMIDR